MLDHNAAPAFQECFVLLEASDKDPSWVLKLEKLSSRYYSYNIKRVQWPVIIFQPPLPPPSV